MKFKELIDKYNWEDICSTFIQLYPDEERNIVGYKRVFEELRTLKPLETKMSIVVEDVFDEYDRKYYFHVYGKDGTLNSDINPDQFKDNKLGNQEVSYGIEFTNWAEFLSMNIDDKSLVKYSELDIIGHCLWEITFYGFTQKDIKRVIKEIDKRVDKKK